MILIVDGNTPDVGIRGTGGDGLLTATYSRPGGGVVVYPEQVVMELISSGSPNVAVKVD